MPLKSFPVPPACNNCWSRACSSISIACRRDAAGDRLVQLDLVNAYTRLGNIQGNPYDQNLGDPAGALVSLDKALAIAQSLAASAARDNEALAGAGLVQQARSEVLWGVERHRKRSQSMQAATEAYDRLVAERDATPALISRGRLRRTARWAMS